MKNISNIKFVARSLRFSIARVFVVPVVLFSLLFQTSGIYAAVPVYIVQQDAGTLYELSLENFMFNLFNKLAARQEDFAASFELMKIEKAREDVNKLFQESLKELEDYGAVVSRTDDWTTKSSTGPGTSDDYTLSALKGSRIITDPYDYLFNEPLAAGRITGICYYLSVIADQRGWLFSGSPVKATFSDRYDEAPPSQTNPFNANTNQSVNRIWHNLTAFLMANNPGPNKINEFLDNESIFLNKPAFENTATGKTELMRRIFYCTGILASFGIDSPSATDYLFATYKVNGLSLDPTQAKQFRQNVLGLPTLINNGPTYEQARLAREGINNIGGIGNTASIAAAGVIQKIAKIHEVSFVAGQGVRPQNLYLTYKEQNRGTVAGPHSSGPQDSAFLLNTERVISPAVVLLQKMQAATQSEFDLAGQGFLYLNNTLDPDIDTHNELLNRYNLSSNINSIGTDPANPRRSSPRTVCNEVGATVGVTDKCFVLDPWLSPAATFRTAPDETLVSASRGSGLPAPFEDDSEYLRLGDGYTINEYRTTTGVRGARRYLGDNIGNKLNGVDFSINDWFDRVIEMYQPNPGNNWFTLQDSDCSIATWFTKLRIDVPIGGTPWSPDPTPLDFAAQCAHRIPPLSGGAGDGSY